MNKTVIYRDGALERIMGDYGYMDGEGGLHYYIKDYQGNVRAVIDGQGALEEVNNYYPYGALLGGGTLGNPSVQPYKYGTKELDRQNGLDWYDSQARMYDPVLGRTPTMDPKAEDYAPISPYAWCSGNPVRNIDPDGNIIRTYIDGIAYDYRMGEDGIFGFYNQDGEMYEGSNSFVFDLANSLQILQEGRFGKMFISDIMNSDNIATICYNTKESNSTLIENNIINWNPDNLEGGVSWNVVDGYSRYRPPYIGLAHELAHISDAWFGTFDESYWFKFRDKIIDKTEIYASQIENVLRSEHSIPSRTHYAFMDITVNEKHYSIPYAPARIPNVFFYYKRPFPFNPVPIFNYFPF